MMFPFRGWILLLFLLSPVAEIEKINPCNQDDIVIVAEDTGINEVFFETADNADDRDLFQDGFLAGNLRQNIFLPDFKNEKPVLARQGSQKNFFIFQHLDLPPPGQLNML